MSDAAALAVLLVALLVLGGCAVFVEHRHRAGRTTRIVEQYRRDVGADDQADRVTRRRRRAGRPLSRRARVVFVLALAVIALLTPVALLLTGRDQAPPALVSDVAGITVSEPTGVYPAELLARPTSSTPSGAGPSSTPDPDRPGPAVSPLPVGGTPAGQPTARGSVPLAAGRPAADPATSAGRSLRTTSSAPAEDDSARDDDQADEDEQTGSGPAECNTDVGQTRAPSGECVANVPDDDEIRPVPTSAAPPDRGSCPKGSRPGRIAGTCIVVNGGGPNPNDEDGES